MVLRQGHNWDRHSLTRHGCVDYWYGGYSCHTIREFELSWEETWGKVPTLSSKTVPFEIRLSDVDFGGWPRAWFDSEVALDFKTGKAMSVVFSVYIGF